MPPTLRRSLSWLLTLASLACLAVSITYLPGAAGALAELHWLLARDNSSPAQFNRAFSLLLFAEDHARGSRAQLLCALLYDKDQRIVRGCLKCVAPQAPFRGKFSEDVSLAFLKWFEQAETSEKVALLPETYMCWLAATSGVTVVGDHILSFPAPPRESMTALNVNGRRWIVAATVVIRGWDRALVEMLIFPGSRVDPPTIGTAIGIDPTDDVAQRLQYVDGFGSDALLAKLVDIGELKRIAVGSLCTLIGVPADELLTMLSDPIDQVRWGAGRILAVAGDERGLPAFCDWLQHNPRFASNANKLMTDLFGPDWRTHCASGSSASQPGQRDGGG